MVGYFLGAEQAGAAVDVVATLIGSGLLVVGAGLAYVLTRYLALRVLSGIVRRSATDWDDRFLHHQVPHRLSLIPPALVVYLAAPTIQGLPAAAETATQRVALTIVIVSFAAALFATLNAVNEIYEEQVYAADRPIKSYLQLVKLIVAIFAAVLVVATLADQSPVLLLSGLGAATAVLLLVFRDTILSLVASVQLATNDLIRLGDWIQMDAHGADGEVIDIALHTVKVRNWNLTVVSLPTHKLISESFINWRGMIEAGGRRIMRAVHIDVTSVRFLDDAELDRFASWPRLREHIDTKRAELGVEGGGHDPEAAATRAARRLTNIGVFRAYCEAYLREREDLRVEDMMLMVRQLPATSEGVAIELYGFTRTTAWAEHEAIQADIFDHLLAILPAFGLRPYQHPTSTDVSGLQGTQAGEAGRRAVAG